MWKIVKNNWFMIFANFTLLTKTFPIHNHLSWKKINYKTFLSLQNSSKISSCQDITTKRRQKLMFSYFFTVWLIKKLSAHIVKLSFLIKYLRYKSKNPASYTFTQSKTDSARTIWTTDRDYKSWNIFMRMLYNVLIIIDLLPRKICCRVVKSSIKIC